MTTPPTPPTTPTTTPPARTTTPNFTSAATPTTTRTPDTSNPGGVPPLTSGRRDETLGSGRDGNPPGGGLQPTSGQSTGKAVAMRTKNQNETGQCTGDAVCGGGTTPGDDDGEPDVPGLPSRSKPGTTPDPVPVSGKMPAPAAPGMPKV